MRYGHFDNEKKEYVIDNVALPASWTNYLGVKDTCCLLYTSDAADDLLCVDLGGRRIIKKKKNEDPYTQLRA